MVVAGVEDNPLLIGTLGMDVVAKYRFSEDAEAHGKYKECLQGRPGHRFWFISRTSNVLRTRTDYE